MFLKPEQQEAVDKLQSGMILVANTGAGKSRTGIYWYFKENGGAFINDDYQPMKDPKDLYIITTANKRDTHDWDRELSLYLLSTDPEVNYYHNKVVVNSWQQIAKYKDISDAYFLFDEDHLTGSGAWVKTFLRIAQHNKWIILTATPGDKYEDYGPVFVANGYFRSIYEFKQKHLVYDYRPGWPRFVKCIGTTRLDRLKQRIIVRMNYEHDAEVHEKDILCEFDKELYKVVVKRRWDPYRNAPIENASQFCYCLRKITNLDESRIEACKQIVNEKNRVIIFYNHDPELELLKSVYWGKDISVAELNGHAHEAIPSTPKWVYLVNYAAGAEAWECTKTDTVIFYSLNYSYKTMVQAAGRIDRRNTPFSDLYYYRLKSRAPIDLAIEKCLKEKKTFNENTFAQAL